MRRFDEIELVSEVFTPPQASSAPVMRAPHSTSPTAAKRFYRILTFLTDLSLFLALALVLSTLLATRGEWEATISREWDALLSLGGFLLLISYFYFAGCWLLWGKTIGGAIFDVRVVDENGQPVDLARASRRWAFAIVSILLCGGGFLLAVLPGGRSLPDRMSQTICIYEP